MLAKNILVLTYKSLLEAEWGVWLWLGLHECGEGKDRIVLIAFIESNWQVYKTKLQSYI